MRVQDTVQVHFKLLEFVNLTPEGKFSLINLDGVVKYDGGEQILMFDLPDDRVDSLTWAATPPALLWDRLADDSALAVKARENFVGSAVLRLERITERGQSQPLEPMSFKNESTVNGFALQAKKTYDLNLAYNIITTPGTHANHSPCSYLFSNPAEHFEVARTTLPVTGNYRIETLWVQPKVGLPASVNLEWIDSEKQEKSSSAEAIELIALRIPVSSEALDWPLDRIIYLIVVLCTLAGGLLFTYLAVKSTSQEETKSLVPIYTSLTAFCAATCVSYLKDVLKKPS
ncbi:MAG: hypothetical protein ABUT39_03530 [Acidobacteriota bacterium]